MDTAWKRADTDWFMRAGWGVFTHYLVGEHFPEGQRTTADAWNRAVDAFDVDGLAAQLAAVRAPYYFMTLGQGSGHYCAPNETYDRYAGVTPSKCSRRDLISDLYAALHPRGIELLVYVPADGPWADAEARRGFGLTTHWSDDPTHNWGPGEQWAKFRLSEFQRRWEEVCRDWSLRFGRKIRGWWVDGAYAKEQRYPADQEPNLRSYALALKAGNPDAMVAFNPGVRVPVTCYSEYEDYTAGELSGDLPVGGWGFGDNPKFCNYGPVRRFCDGAQFHVLNFLGPWWSAAPPRFPTALVAGYTQYINAQQGVVTWDVPISLGGLIPEPFLAQLAAIGAARK